MHTSGNIALRIGLWEVIVVMILMIPYVANAPWTGSDFVFAGVVLSGCAITYVLLTRNSDVRHRVAVGAAVLFFIFLVIGWAAAGP